MKKIWKNLCVCSMAVACGVGMVGCGKDNDAVSKDLDGDGVVSSWETLFDSNISTEDTSTSTITGEITYISNADDLLAINNNVSDKKIYVLKNNIDLGGRSACINLGKSELYGNNYVISNFKLGSYYPAVNIEEGASTESSLPSGVHCLFYGGIGVYDLRVFMGYQFFTLNEDSNIRDYQIATFINVPYLDNIAVKGKINIDSPKVTGRSYINLNASLMYSQMTTSTIDDYYETITENIVSIRNVSVDGAITYSDADETMVKANIGAVASNICTGSTIYIAKAKVNIIANSSQELNLGGLVGVNKGFISTASCSGTISTSYRANVASENIGGLVGINDSLAEIKNSTSNVSVSFSLSEDLVSFNRDAVFNYGGAVGYNKGGILEYLESDALININNVYSINVGGLCGKSDKGIISYALCRGSIDIKDTDKVLVAQVSGMSNKGLMEKIITTTNINVDNSNTSSAVNVGMVTIFEDVDNMSEDYTAEDSPYFKRILVDGITTVYMKSGDTFRYALGLRNSYRKIAGTETSMDDEGNEVIETIYESKLPEIFSNIYYTNKSTLSTTGCQLYKYELKDGQKTENSPTITYAKNEYNQKCIVTAGSTTSWIIDSLDFKNFLNHNEVNVADGVAISDLHFTLDSSMQELSYFGGSKYNGELAYFDREFTTSYTHETSSLGNCEYDAVDEFMSFVYNTITSQSGSASFAIKISDEFLKVDRNNSDESNTINFASIVGNVFTCLNTPVTVVLLNASKEDINSEDTTSGDNEVRYIQATFEDTNNYYTMLFDIDNLTKDVEDNAITQSDAYIIILKFTVEAKLGV